jgi:prepilin-type N-terminal cleavage/methylation domain-containing protein
MRTGRLSKAHIHGRHRGLSLVEVMLCTAIGAMLMTSVAVAFKSSFNSYKDSQQRGQMLNAARGFMYRITSDIRMCDSAAPYDPTVATANTETTQFNTGKVPGSVTAGLPSAGGTGVIGIQLTKSHADTWDPLASPTNPVLITYWLNTATMQVMCTRKYGSVTPTATPVCSFVQTFQIYMMPVLSGTASQGQYVLRRAVIDMSLANKDANGNRILTDGGQDLTLTFSDAAVPRKTFPGL